MPACSTVADTHSMTREAPALGDRPTQPDSESDRQPPPVDGPASVGLMRRRAIRSRQTDVVLYNHAGARRSGEQSRASEAAGGTPAARVSSRAVLRADAGADRLSPDRGISTPAGRGPAWKETEIT